MIELDDVLAATGGEVLHAGRSRFRGAVIDSRQVRQNDLFFALPGKNADGHDFLGEVFRRGGGGAVISKRRKKVPRSKTIILVKDTLRALQDLGRFYRSRSRIPFVAITGSSGKTTTKEMVAAVLSQKFRVFKNRGNLNTEIGVPQSLTQLSPRHEVGVVELAMQKRGEIRELTQMVRPQIGVITNIGPAHIEFLKSLENIAHAKAELLEELPPDGLAILPADNRFYPLLSQCGGDRKMIRFGTSRKSDVRASRIELKKNRTVVDVETRAHPLLGEPRKFTLQLSGLGQHFALNSLVAIALGLLHQIPVTEIQRALEKFKPVAGRFSISNRRRMLIIHDEYNANPDSMHKAIETLAALRKARRGRAIAVLGDMLELGRASRMYHRQMGQLIRREQIDFLIALGPESQVIAKAAQKNGSVWHVDHPHQAARILERLARPGDVILFKASRGMHLERVAKLARIG